MFDENCRSARYCFVLNSIKKTNNLLKQLLGTFVLVLSAKNNSLH